MTPLLDPRVCVGHAHSNRLDHGLKRVKHRLRPWELFEKDRSAFHSQQVNLFIVIVEGLPDQASAQGLEFVLRLKQVNVGVTEALLHVLKSDFSLSPVLVRSFLGDDAAVGVVILLQQLAKCRLRRLLHLARLGWCSTLDGRKFAPQAIPCLLRQFVEISERDEPRFPLNFLQYLDSRVSYFFFLVQEAWQDHFKHMVPAKSLASRLTFILLVGGRVNCELLTNF